METKQAIKLLDVKMQNSSRILAATELQQIFNFNSHYDATQKRYTDFNKQQQKDPYLSMTGASLHVAHLAQEYIL
jgi:hypothetical protein